MSESDSGGPAPRSSATPAATTGDEILAAVQRLPQPAGVLDLLENDLRIVWINAAGAAALHRTCEQVAGKLFSELPGVSTNLPEMLAGYRTAQQSGQPSRFELQFEIESATAVFATTAVPLGNNGRLFFTSEDVTRRASLENLLRAGEAKYHAVFSAAQDGIALFNLDTLRCVEANEAFGALYGFSHAELREVTLQQLGDPAAARALAEEVSLRGTVHITGAMNTRRDGTTFPAECDALLLELSERRVLCLICHDLTTQRRLQEKLLMSDRFASMGTLAAGVAHEVNNPLAYLLANLTFVVERLPELRDAGTGMGRALDELTPALKEAITGAQRVKEIVTDLKTFSRPELPGGAPVELPAILEAVLRLLHGELKRRATLVREIASELPRVNGHEARLAQVFLHLFNNALEALRDRPAAENQLRIAARATETEVVVELEDNGVGIPAELLPRVFDPFFTTRAVGNGTGLGLSVCHGIISALGGRMELESKVGQGTLVRVTLPQAVGEKMRPASDPTILALPSLPRLVVIDDEPLLSEAIRRMLLGEIEVLPMTTVDQALAMLASGEKVDAILCDLHLDGRGGAALHEELSRSTPTIAKRLGFITGGAVNDEDQAFVRKHADRVLDKPFSRNGLRALVKSLMS